jgi:hypothetical protein
VAKPLRHRDKWRIRWLDEHGKRQDRRCAALKRKAVATHASVGQRTSRQHYRRRVTLRDPAALATSVWLRKTVRCVGGGRTGSLRSVWRPIPGLHFPGRRSLGRYLDLVQSAGAPSGSLRGTGRRTGRAIRRCSSVSAVVVTDGEVVGDVEQGQRAVDRIPVGAFFVIVSLLRRTVSRQPAPSTTPAGACPDRPRTPARCPAWTCPSRSASPAAPA